jgi:hypothetical protein
MGSADAHRRKRQRSRGPTHPVRQAEEVMLVSKSQSEVIRLFIESALFLDHKRACKRLFA